jgi:hypothetical protein
LGAEGGQTMTPTARRITQFRVACVSPTGGGKLNCCGVHVLLTCACKDCASERSDGKRPNAMPRPVPNPGGGFPCPLGAGPDLARARCSCSCGLLVK